MIKKILIGLVIFVVLVVGGFLLYIKFSSVDVKRAGEAVGKTIPSVTITNIATNKEVDLQSFKGKYLFLNFWATWCGPCVAEMPLINEAYPKYKDKMEFALISMDNKIDDPIKFIKEKNYTMPVYFPHTGDVSKLFDIQAIPTSFIIGPDGKFVSVHVGTMANKAELEAFLNTAQ